ncbi:Uncharacterised protein [Porphyromonas cangingivalis]|nr:Uncharacterised protein [Porphyromonas cangingivalis]
MRIGGGFCFWKFGEGLHDEIDNNILKIHYIYDRIEIMKKT